MFNDVVHCCGLRVSECKINEQFDVTIGSRINRISDIKRSSKLITASITASLIYELEVE